MAKRRKFLAVTALILLGGCHPFCDDDFTQRVGMDQFSERKEQWQNLAIDTYVLKITLQCFCFHPYYEVSVVDGEVVSVQRPTNNGGALANVDEAFITFGTIDAAFEHILQQNESVDILKVGYDASLGYPTSIEIDPMTDRQYCDGSGSSTID